MSELDSLRIENVTLRVTLHKTLRLLLPIAVFVITQHAYLYLEILDIKFYTFTGFVTVLFSGLVSAFFLVYAYAVVINGIGAQVYTRDHSKLNLMKKEDVRFKHVEKLSKEALFLGIAIVNGAYLLFWVCAAFGLLRFFAGLISYFIASLVASTGCLALGEWIYGIEE